MSHRSEILTLTVSNLLNFVFVCLLWLLWLPLLHSLSAVVRFLTSSNFLKFCFALLLFGHHLLPVKAYLIYEFYIHVACLSSLVCSITSIFICLSVWCCRVESSAGTVSKVLQSDYNYDNAGFVPVFAVTDHGKYVPLVETAPSFQLPAECLVIPLLWKE